MLLLLTLALAQEHPAEPVAPVPSDPSRPPGDGPVAPPDGGGPDAPPPFDPLSAVPLTSAPELPPAPDLPRARTSLWTPVGPVGEDRFVDVAMHPQRAGIWATVQRDGSVWVTVDGGVDWIEVLQGVRDRLGVGSRDEELILNVQARIDELTGSLGDADSEEEAEDLAAEAAAAAQDVASSVQGEIQQGLWSDEQGTARGTGRPRVGFAANGMLLVSRRDGLRVSPDLGAMWVPVLDVPIAHAVEVAPGEVLAVGPQGAWASSDLVQWSSVVLPMRVAPTDLVVDGGVWASTPGGVWVLRGSAWRELPSGPMPLTVRPATSDPYPDLVVGSAQDIFRATPFDAVVDPVLGGPISSVNDIERTQDGSLLAASSAGPYESRDGGRTWQAFTEGLSDPSVEAIGVRGGEVVLVGTAGVWRLDPRPEILPEAPTRPTSLPPFASLNALIESSLTRPELSQKVGNRLVAALFPQVQLEYTQVHDEGPTWLNNDPGGTTYNIDGYWRAHMRLTWAPNRQRNSTSFGAEAGQELPVVVVGGDVIVAGEEAPQVLYSKVSRGGAKYRGGLAARITELYRLRARILLEAPPSDVRRAVLRELNLAEVDAKLDALTRGAVSAYLTGVAVRAASGGAP